MTEQHKQKIAEMIMNDYDIRPSLAHTVVKIIIETIEKIIKEDEGIKR